MKNHFTTPVLATLTERDHDVLDLTWTAYADEFGGYVMHGVAEAKGVTLAEVTVGGQTGDPRGMDPALKAYLRQTLEYEAYRKFARLAHAFGPEAKAPPAPKATGLGVYAMIY